MALLAITINPFYAREQRDIQPYVVMDKNQAFGVSLGKAQDHDE